MRMCHTLTAISVPRSANWSPTSNVDIERHGEIACTAHLVPENGLHGVRLAGRGLDHEFIMYLKDLS